MRRTHKMREDKFTPSVVNVAPFAVDDGDNGNNVSNGEDSNNNNNKKDAKPQKAELEVAMSQ